MKKLFTRSLGLALSASLVLGLSACGGGGQGQAPSGGSGSTTPDPDGKAPIILNLSDNENLSNINIYNNASSPNYSFAEMIFDSLLQTDHTGNETPGICKEYDLSEDGCTVTMHIQEGVKFHDGSDCNADDVLATMQFILDNLPTLGTMSGRWTTLVSAEKVDDSTVQLNLSAPVANLEIDMAYTYVLSSDDLAQYGGDMFTKGIMNGTGPWKYVEWVDGQYSRFARNDDYWRGQKSNVDEIYVWYIREANAAIASYISKSIDYITRVDYDLLPMLDQVKDQSNINVALAEVMYYLQFKMDGKAPSSDENFRKAFMHAIDRESLLDLVGGGAVINDIYTAGCPGHRDDLAAITYDPAKAKEYLAKSNYNGETLQFYSRNDITGAEAMLTAMADYLGQVGINVQVNIVDGASFNTIRKEGTYDVFMVNVGTYDGDPLSQYLVPRILQDCHSHGYVNDALNALISSAASDFNEESRVATLEQIDQIMYDLQGPIVPVLQYDKYSCVRKGIEGLNETTCAGTYYRDVYVDEAVWGK